MVIGLVLWAVSVGLIVTAVAFAVRKPELFEKISKCYLMRSTKQVVVFLFLFFNFF